MTKMTRTQVTRRPSTAVAVTIAAIALLASACGSDADNADSDKPPVAGTTPPSSIASDVKSTSVAKSSITTSAAESSASTSSSDRSSASVDSKSLDATFETSCAKADESTALSLVDTDNATYGMLTVSAIIDESGSVQTAGVAGTEGSPNGLPYTVSYVQGVPGGSATVERDGNTFTVTGEGAGSPDIGNPTSATTSTFQITFVCSTVVDG